MVAGELPNFTISTVETTEGVELTSSELASVGTWDFDGGEGTVSVTSEDGETFIATLIAGSPVWMEKQVDTFYDYFRLSFNANFGSEMGVLSVLLGDELLMTFDAADFSYNKELFFNFDFFKSSQWDESETLRFHWLSDTGNFVNISNISFVGQIIPKTSFSQIDEPANFLIMLFALCLLLMRRKQI